MCCKDQKAFVELKLVAKQSRELAKSVKEDLEQEDPSKTESEKAIEKATSSVVEGVK